MLRVNNVAKLLDVPDPFCSHFADENFVRRSQGRTNGFDNTHRSVVAFRSHEYIIFSTKKSVEIIFYARLAVASGDSDYSEIGAGGKKSFCVPDVMAVDSFFNRNIDKVGNKSPERRKNVKADNNENRNAFMVCSEKRN